MKITKVENVYVDQFLFVQVHTDEGIVGLGECGAWAFLEACGGAVETFARYLVGQDPLDIEHHWQYMYRCYHFRGAAIMGALSAIDIALWDIAGKYYGVPVYKLLGGKCRDKARTYAHVVGKNFEELKQSCLTAKANGFTAVGHLTPFFDTPRGLPYEFESHAQKINRAIDRIAKYREAIGDEIDMCIEIHRRLKPHEAIVLAEGIAEYRPMFYEDPTMPENFDSMEHIAEHINIPLATGERFLNPQEFAMIISRRAVHYVRPDVCMCGGITATKKIAALAEAFDINVVPHNPLSPVSTAACMQVAVSIPNFSIQEYPNGLGENVVINNIALENGYLITPTAPGIGVSLIEGAAEKFPFKARIFKACSSVDGSVEER